MEEQKIKCTQTWALTSSADTAAQISSLIFLVAEFLCSISHLTVVLQLRMVFISLLALSRTNSSTKTPVKKSGGWVRRENHSTRQPLVVHDDKQQTKQRVCQAQKWIQCRSAAACQTNTHKKTEPCGYRSRCQATKCNASNKKMCHKH